MKVKDLLELSYVCSVYSFCSALNDLLSQMGVDAFPDEVHECIDNLKISVAHAVNCMENYRDLSEKKFFSQCEDYKQ